MGQLFSDIASLTNFLIHKGDKSNPADVKKQGGYDFDDWLTFSIVNNNYWCNDNTKTGIMNDSIGVLENLIDDGINLFEKTEHLDSNNLSSETYSYKILPADELKYLVKTQTVSLILDIQKSEELVGLLKEAFSKNKVGDGEQLLNKQYNNQADTTALEVIAYDEFRKTTPYLHDNSHFQGDVSVQLKPDFIFDKLIWKENQSVPLKINTNDGDIFYYKIPAERLMELLERYPDRILIEVKTTGEDETSINDNKLFSQSTNPSSRKNQQHKYIIFDLKALLEQKDFNRQMSIQKFRVIEKTVITDIRTATWQTGIKDIVEENSGNSQTVVSDNNHCKIRKMKQSSANGFKTLLTSDNDKLTETTVNSFKDFAESIRPRVIADNVVPRQYPAIKINERLDLASSRLSAENGSPCIAIENIDKIINQLRSRLMVIPGRTQMTIKLKPEHLGRLTIDLSYDGKRVEVLFKVETLGVKQILEAEIMRLRTDLNIDNCKIEMALKDFQDFNPSSNGHLHSKTAGGFSCRYLPSANGQVDEDNDKDEKLSIGCSKKYHDGEIDLFI